MRIITLATALALGLTAQTGAVFAWGANGHRITAKLGEDNMDPEARSAMQAISGSRSLALLATWPDFVRSYPVYDCFKPWHFLTVEDGQPIEEALQVNAEVSGGCDEETFKQLDMPNNVVDAIGYFTAILQGDNARTAAFAELLQASGAEPLHGSIPLTALTLVVHFVGDVHQPLHVGRGPDRGGNTITVDWFDEMVNLHHVWDEGLIEREGLSYSEFSAFLEQDFAGQTVEYGDGPVTWAQESVDHRAQVYDFGGNPAYNLPKLSYVYASDNNGLLKERLHRGGMRLAEVLNGIFGG